MLLGLLLQEFQTMVSGLMQNPSMIGAYMNDPRMQLVSCAARSSSTQCSWPAAKQQPQGLFLSASSVCA